MVCAAQWLPVLLPCWPGHPPQTRCGLQAVRTATGGSPPRSQPPSSPALTSLRYAFCGTVAAGNCQRKGVQHQSRTVAHCLSTGLGHI